jgi:hypothetical protein
MSDIGVADLYPNLQLVSANYADMFGFNAIDFNPGSALAAQFTQLTAENDPLCNTNSRRDCRKNCDGNCSIRGKTGRAILAGFFLLSGAALFYGATKALDDPSPPLLFVGIGWLCWLAGFGTVGYGTLLVLSVIGPISPLG